MEYYSAIQKNEIVSFAGKWLELEINMLNEISQDQKAKYCWAPVAHTCNPSYSGGRDQEDCSLKPAWANSLRDSILNNPSQKRAGGVAQGVSPEFKHEHVFAHM
jgi:hypothetical protein